MRTIEIPSGEFVVCVIALMRNFFEDHKQLKKSKLGEFFLYVIFSDSFTVKTVLKIGAVFGSPMDSKIAPCNFCKLCLYLQSLMRILNFIVDD